MASALLTYRLTPISGELVWCTRNIYSALRLILIDYLPSGTPFQIPAEHSIPRAPSSYKSIDSIGSTLPMSRWGAYIGPSNHFPLVVNRSGQIQGLKASHHVSQCQHSRAVLSASNPSGSHGCQISYLPYGSNPHNGYLAQSAVHNPLLEPQQV